MPFPQAIYDFVVLGAGLAGLTFAHEMSRRGRSVAIVEREAQVGGLARTCVFGDYRFDLGGHRFHTLDREVLDWFQRFLGDELLTVGRRSRIYLNGRYVNYPLQFPSALTAFSPAQSLRIILSYLRVALGRRSKNGDDGSFEDWVVHRFGRALYDIYFRPYTEKVWGMDCRKLSADWASQRIQLPSLAAAATSHLLHPSRRPPTLVSRFLYPRLGIGMLTDRLADSIRSSGYGEISTDSSAQEIVWNATEQLWAISYRHGGAEGAVRGRHLISTIPVGALLAALKGAGEEATQSSRRLGYRALVCVFLALAGPPISADTWTYFPDAHLVLGRTHEPPNWSRAMAPVGSTSLCVEVFSSVGDERWSSRDEDLTAAVVNDLEGLGILDARRVLQSWVQRTPEAYPVYHVGYAPLLDTVRQEIARWPRLHLLGRTGEFRYLNMDRVIGDALHLAGRLMEEGATVDEGARAGH